MSKSCKDFIAKVKSEAELSHFTKICQKKVVNAKNNNFDFLEVSDHSRLSLEICGP